MLTELINPSPEELSSLLKRPVNQIPDIEVKVESILLEVQKGGDNALRELSLRFDNVNLDRFEVSRDEIDASEAAIPEKLKNAIRLAAGNIETFHRAQHENFQVIETMPGVQCWRKSVAIEKVGLYIPGGSAPLFSTLLMLAVPARLAGCGEIILCTPPGPSGKINSAILYAAKHTGINRIFRVGGAQAIAAMAFGTESIPRVSKIFGPGNNWVTTAKQLVSAKGTAIDMPAGPSELAVIADSTANPDFVAADLLSQAEHGPDSQVVLVTDDDDFIQAVLKAIRIQAEALPRREIALKALSNSYVIKVNNLFEGMDLINEYAPEHLIISAVDETELSQKVINAGSVFIGNYSPESAGDYASGTNHTLPTLGNSRAFSGVSLDSFLRKITFQQISRKGLENIGPSIEVMAEAEGLQAHKNAVSIRLKS